jgi:hypothetical protein
VTTASTWHVSVNAPPPHTGTADPSHVCRLTCILGTLRRQIQHFSALYVTSLSAPSLPFCVGAGAKPTSVLSLT